MPSNDVLTNSALKNRLIDSLKLLLIPGIGLKRYKVLVEELGSPGAVLGSSVARLGSLPRISENLAEAVHSSETAREATEIAARIIQLGWEVKFLGDDDYPQLLSKIADPPPLLFCVGSTAPTVELRIAIVGTRRASEQGRTFASNLARALVENGITVVSGMAEGIDSAAHTGALEAGGRTIAVWGSSLDIVYPSSNRTLAERIKGSGAVYSEYLPGTRPDTSTFPARNRIISGLSEGVVVVEAGVKSGALITASHALDQEREVFAVPGSPVSRSSQGTNALIKSGARLITSVDDIFDELPRLRGEVIVRRVTQRPEITDSEKAIMNLFSSGPMQIDQISRAMEKPTGELMELLLALELKGVLTEISGKRFVLSEEFAR